MSLPNVVALSAGLDQRSSSAHSFQTPYRPITELPQIFRTDVGKFVMFQVRPNVFDRVQFGGVSRQAFDVNPSVQSADIFGDDLATVGRMPIPHNEEFAGYVPNQMLEEDNHMPAADRFLEQLKVEHRHTRLPDCPRPQQDSWRNLSEGSLCAGARSTT